MLISICLPVRNDAEALGRTLVSLLSQWQEDWSDMEVIVSDNASEDDSFNTAIGLLSTKDHCKVLRQESNLGFAGNLVQLAGQAKGDYLWFIGAGDTIRQNGVEAVRRLLASGDPLWGSLGGSYSKRTIGLAEPLKAGAVCGHSDVPNSVPVFNIAISLNFFRRETFLQSTFSAYLPSSSDWTGDSGLEDIWKYEIHYWPHLESILQYVINHSGDSYSWAYLAEDIVELDMNKNGSWNERPSVMRVYAQWLDLVNKLLHAIPNAKWLVSESKRLATTHLWEYAFSITLRKLLRPVDLVRQLPKQNVGLASRMLVWIIAFSPLPLLRSLSGANNIRKSILKRRSWHLKGK